MVVLDEATANIDTHTERAVQDLIQSELGHATVLTIAHRLNTVMGCDRVKVLHEGKCQEFDTPTKLLEDKESAFSSSLVGVSNS